MLAATMMRRGGNRARLLSLVGQAPADPDHYHALSSHQAAYLLGLGHRSVHELFVQLVAGGVLERRPGAGSRPDAWRARDVRRWQVQWPKRRGPDGAEWVRLVLAEHGLLVPVVPGGAGELSRGPIAAQERGFSRGPIAAQAGNLLRGPGTAQEAAGSRAVIEPRKRSSSSLRGAAGGPSLRLVGEEEEERETDRPYVRSLSGLVLRLTGRPVFGRGVDQLARLEGRLSLETAERTLSGLPTDAGWPMILAALIGAIELGDTGPPAEQWTLPITWWNGAGSPRVELRRCASLETAHELRAGLLAGVGWPDGTSDVEVDDPIR